MSQIHALLSIHLVIGVMMACFHWKGTKENLMHLLSKTVTCLAIQRSSNELAEIIEMTQTQHQHVQIKFQSGYDLLQNPSMYSLEAGTVLAGID